MDGIRGEVSNKIRSAIKAKLMELGAYVDDELPDYIMVMVANKRSRQQMEDDLQLFLGDSTSTFTAWLHTVLNKLQQVTVNNAELKKGADKKKSDDEKKDKRKKPKKEKDKEKSEKPEKPGKIHEKTRTKSTSGEDQHAQEQQIKCEPAEQTVNKGSLPIKNSTEVNTQPTSSVSTTVQEKSSVVPRANEEEDDDDFINLKADVETDMWGETEESGAAKSSNAKATSVSNETKFEEPMDVDMDQNQQASVSSEKSMSVSIAPEAAVVLTSVSPSKSTDSRPAPRIIKISETIRQEQETMKPSSKAAREPQQEERRAPSPIVFFTKTSETIEDDLEIFGRHIARELRKMSPKVRKLAKLKIKQGLAKRVFQSHIVSLRNAQEKPDRSHNDRSQNDRSQRQSSSSHSNTTDNHSRRVEQRSRNQEDLRDTLRKDHRRESDRGRNREHDRRRSRDRSYKPRESSKGRAISSHRDENSPDPAMASVVRVTPRPQLPAALQANRSLILKAVAEAQRSVTRNLVRPDVSEVKVRPNFMKLIKPEFERARIRKQLNVQVVQPQKRNLPILKLACLPSRMDLKRMASQVTEKREREKQAREEALAAAAASAAARAEAAAQAAAELEENSDESSFIIDPSLNILIQVPASPVEDSHEPQDPIQTEKVRRWIKDVEEATKSDNVPLDAKTDLTTDAGTEADNDGSECVSKQVSDEEYEDTLEVDTNSLKTSDIHSVVISDDRSLRQPSNTQFVVTLDGLDPRLLRSFAMEGDGFEGHIPSEQMDTDCNQDDRESLIREELVKEQLLREELLRQQAAIREQKASRNNTSAGSSVLASKRPGSPSSFLEVRPPKVSSTQIKSPTTERCMFWPGCKNGEKCEFYHPTVPCKLFPNCKYSDRCLYIHPTCRFNSMCTRPDCSYTHTGPRPSLSTQTVGSNPLTSQPIKQACKYFPNCSNPNCPYIHPTVCKYGTHCTRPKCQFIHSDKGLMTKHKWVRQ